MKSQPKIEATARPWEFRHIKSGCHVITVGAVESFGNGQYDIDPVCDMSIPEPTLERDIELAKANAALIVKAVNEFEALEAVAIQMGAWMNFLEERSGDERGLQKTRESLANLEAVRKEGK